MTRCVGGGSSTTLRGGATVGGGVSGGTGGRSGGRAGSQFNGGVGCGMGVDCGATLRAGAASRGDGVVGGMESPVSSVVSCCKVVTWLSVSRASEDAGDGCWRAWAASIRSLEEVRGILILVGNQERMSDMRSARVANIQIW